MKTFLFLLVYIINHIVKMKKIENICHNIMDNIILYLSDFVYVEKNDNVYSIKTYHDNEKDKYLHINICENYFSFNLSKNTGVLFIISQSTQSKNSTYDTGDFKIDIDDIFLKKYLNWLENKYEEFLIKKAKVLESKLYELYEIDKKIKRKKINTTLKKEEL
jgi:hypothetical protein